uniref:Nucleolar GTP-binding protein 2 N-terminal domain-containing protein n=1 Tax=Salix viminalis TaxID=40686 RepID=A0A6N2K7N8_SALVM
MAKMKEKKSNISGKPKHSLDTNRSNGKTKDTNSRSAATVRRLQMYGVRPKRDSKGKILKHDFQSNELPNTRIQPDRRWFGNTRVVNQKELEFFREELQSRMSSSYNVILKERKLPLSLLNDHQKQARVHLLDTQPFQDAFGPKTKRKRPRLLAGDYESLVKKADGSQDDFEQKYGDEAPGEGTEADGFRDLVRHTMFEKGQSKRIWGELYKVIDSSDVVVQLPRKSIDVPMLNINLLPLQGSPSVSIRQFAPLKNDKQAISVVLLATPMLKIISYQHITEDDNDFLLQLCKSTGKLLKNAGDSNKASACCSESYCKCSCHPSNKKSVPVQRDLFSENELKGNGDEQAVAKLRMRSPRTFRDRRLIWLTIFQPTTKFPNI